MSVLLAIDPGVRGCGCAVFETGKLVACAYVRNLVKSGHGPFECASMAQAVMTWWETAAFGRIFPPDVVVVEWPRIYQRGGGRTKGDPNDLLCLVAVDGALAVYFRTAKTLAVEPHQWKGSMPKTGVVEGRVRARLDAVETDALEAGVANLAASLRHNLFDGVGIGLFALGRFDRLRAFEQ